MTTFNMGMPGNPHVDKLLERGRVSDGEASYLATMALAFEQRTVALALTAIAFPETADDKLKDEITKGRLAL